MPGGEGGNSNYRNRNTTVRDTGPKPASTTTPAATPAAPTAPVRTPATVPAEANHYGARNPTMDATLVPGRGTQPGQVGAMDWAGALAMDPSLGIRRDDPTTRVNESGALSDHVPRINADANGTTLNRDNYAYQPGSGPQVTAQTGSASTASQVQAKDAKTYQAVNSYDKIKNEKATAQQGTVSDKAIIKAEQADMKGLATGVNEDGSTSYTGQALQEYATQNISTIIDTSTPSGKALAKALGEGGYTDSKATLKGQLDILQSEFIASDGSPKIPIWAQGVARSVSKIAAFSGMTGTAATSAMANALMEASLPVAQADAQFFQTLTLKNLDNRQMATLNRANVLAKFDQMNLDNRMLAAVENAKSFLQMDLTNLNNRQQTELFNTQARVQSILEDSRAENVARQFNAQSQNEMNMFYDQLNSQIGMFNSVQKNQMTMANMDAINSTRQFNAQLEANREQFYKTMQFNVDMANAKWRQDVTMQNAQMAFDAAAVDVRMMNGMSMEAMNQIWDRSDAMLDYYWKSSESEANRNFMMMRDRFAAENADDAGWGSMFGSIAGNAAGSDGFWKWMMSK